ncbi:hypothetical protein HU200_041412 [Digitaria exilis]|uniref:HECT-type E3 ubiquitin transferase n=1 Tax=Digitaria exilis TaxID=1010633 RepID=A0A835B7N1_9POAL|nr:hypothetical protein HU200_041412 [Digitaria exilis]
MAPSAAAATSVPDDSTSGTVQLLLRNFDSRTTVIRAHREDTLDSVLHRLFGKVAGVAGLRILHAGRDLPCGATIGELGLPRDATLHVSSRLRSTAHPQAWSLATEIANVARLAPSSWSLESLVRKFLNLLVVIEPGSSVMAVLADHLEIFVHSGAPVVLVQQYLSPPQRTEAERAIRCIMAPDRIFKGFTAPVLLEVCRSMFAAGEPKDDHGHDMLYTDLRRVVAKALSDPGWASARWLDVSRQWVAELVNRFAVDMARAVMEDISGATNCGFPASTEVATTTRNLFRFKIFWSVLLELELGLDEKDTPQLPWRATLSETLVSLLRSVDECMVRFETTSMPPMWTISPDSVWEILAVLDAWSSEQDARWLLRRALRATLAEHAAAVTALVLSAGREVMRMDGRWITRHRDLLPFEARRHLAMAVLPEIVTGVHAPPPYEMLIDRSQLLPESFGYIARVTPRELPAGMSVAFMHEEAAGPGVLREWFCLVCQALFNPSLGLFSAKLLILRTSTSRNHLPTSQTCFYHLNIPAYTSPSRPRNPMAQSAAAASAADSSSFSSGVVQLLLRNIDSRTTVVQAQPDETLDSVLARLSNGAARRGELRVVYAGRDLPRDATIGELGLPRDATLHVSSRLLSTPHIGAWGLASEIADAARLAAAGHHSSAWSVEKLVTKFLDFDRAAKAFKSGGSSVWDVADHMDVFLRSGAPALLVRFYLSGQRGSTHAVPCLLPPDKAWTAPVLLEFCGSLAAGGARVGDHIYTDLRGMLVAELSDPKWTPKRWRDVPRPWVAEQLTRLARDMANAVIEEMSPSGPREAQAETETTTKNLAEFKIIWSVLREKMLELYVVETPPRRPPWRKTLSETLVSLVRSVNDCMAKMSSPPPPRRKFGSSSSSSAVPRWTASLRTAVWAVLAELDAWPDVYHAMRTTLAAHAPVVTALVLSLSTGREVSQNARWITRHRDILEPKARRHLAMAMLPELITGGGGAPPPFEMLIDRAWLLPDSFGYIAHATPQDLRGAMSVAFKHEQANGPGVLREWFCLVCQALFNPLESPPPPLLISSSPSTSLARTTLPPPPITT